MMEMTRTVEIYCTRKTIEMAFLSIGDTIYGATDIFSISPEKDLFIEEIIEHNRKVVSMGICIL